MIELKEIGGIPKGFSQASKGGSLLERITENPDDGTLDFERIQYVPDATLQAIKDIRDNTPDFRVTRNKDPLKRHLKAVIPEGLAMTYLAAGFDLSEPKNLNEFLRLNPQYKASTAF
jgi:hypothetical protein